MPTALSPAQLRPTTDPSTLRFATTADIEPSDAPIGQDRALDALRFGTRIEAAGFNLFVIGAADAGLDRTIRTFLEVKARAEPAPVDWVYVNNFASPQRPYAMQLPPGRGPLLRDAIRDLIKDLAVALPAAFDGQDYRSRRTAIDEAFRRNQEEAFSALTDAAAKRHLAILRSPMGFGVAPVGEDGNVLKSEVFNGLPEAERKAIQASVQEFEKRLEQILQTVPRWDKERRDEIRTLDRETAQYAVGHSIEETRGLFTDLPQVLEHLQRMRDDLVDRVGVFFAPQGEEADGEGKPAADGPLENYEVNVFVTQPGPAGAPVIEEPHPSLGNLVGRIEHEWRRGVLMTNFRRLKAGALHRANGGYLLLDARSALLEPFSWLALKRALKMRRIKVEGVDDFLSLTSTVSLEPDPIPLDVKVVLVADRTLYYLLAQFDPDVAEHFKVLADFDDALDRNTPSERSFAAMLAHVAGREGLRALDQAAVARVIEQAARLAQDARKLTLHVDRVRDLLVEANFWAGEARHEVIGPGDVERAIAEQTRRASRVRERTLESQVREIALIDSTGSEIGQVNGLSVLELAGEMFGCATRITARVRPGGGKVIDIEREVELGGPIHSKGVLILSGLLAGRYALDVPLSLGATLVFEQSYGGVEGDSASCAELYALLSALAGLPLRQDLAVTGSVNQMGQVQAIGGVNEKIEGFYDLCAARGLSGSQGVLIPAANVQHLMLRPDVVGACAAGRFAVYPIAHVDEGIALLTGTSAGQRGSDGAFAPGSVNALVEERLRSFARARRGPHQAEDAREES
ncbi:MAG TPA: AAA family ATPase [Burkholderiaceae bacterium]|nr:AAA family ATPase [Burkholderiaceae bacterium]